VVIELDGEVARSPVYLRVVEDITGKIKNGVLQPADALPTPRILAEQYAAQWGVTVSPGTIRRSIGLLQDRGLLVGRKGKGVYVRANPPG